MNQSHKPGCECASTEPDTGECRACSVTGGPCACIAPTCEVCDRYGADAKRCEFGHVSGPCSCWRGVPCDPVPAPILASLVSSPERKLNGGGL